MKNLWQASTLGKILLFVVAIIFAVLFYIAGQYLLSLFTLLIGVIVLRINDLKTFIVSPKDGITAHFRVEDAKIPEIINSSKPPEEKIEESQKVIDEVFKLGYVAGGGNPFPNIWDVKIIRDEEGRIKRVQYLQS